MYVVTVLLSSRAESRGVSSRCTFYAVFQVSLAFGPRPARVNEPGGEGGEMRRVEGLAEAFLGAKNSVSWFLEVHGGWKFMNHER